MRLPKNLLDVSKRTTTKILRRLEIGCSNCGWDKTICDLHHIVHRKDGGTDDHSNLTYICPNCHRLAHDGKLTKFTTVDEQIGNRWKDYYFGWQKDYKKRMANSARNRNTNNIEKFVRERQQEIERKVPGIIDALESSDIDFSKRGWVIQSAPIIGVSPQKVSGWLKKNAPEFYEQCKKRKVPHRTVVGNGSNRTPRPEGFGLQPNDGTTRP